LVCNHFFADSIKHAGYELFFTWYPLLAFINLPLNTALVIMQADRKFGKMLFVKAISSIGFFSVLVVNFFFLEMTLIQIVWALLIMNAITSGICLFAGWDGFKRLLAAGQNGEYFERHELFSTPLPVG